MSKQPEAKLKKALAEGFEEVFGKKSPNTFWGYMKSPKWGVPDQFFAALGRSVWVESKIGENSLEPSQELTIPRMVRGGAVVWLAAGDTHKGSKGQRSVIFSRPGLPAPPYVTLGWDSFKDLVFWKRLLGVSLC